MKVDQMARAQVDQLISVCEQQTFAPENTAYPSLSSNGVQSVNTDMGALYPVLNEYMGLELSENVIALNMPEYLQVATQSNTTSTGLIAPISGQSLGLQRAQVTHGIRQLTVCKDANYKVGLRVRAINKGIFVCLINSGSPAALAGLRFGDQILEVNGISVAGFTMDQVHDMFRKSPVNGISVVVRDRPFERTLTLHKDSVGHIGFQLKNGKIVSLIKDSSAARNGLLTEHNLLEINGQNVVGLKDKETTRIIEGAEQIVTVTVIPTFIYEHMIKNMSTSLLKGAMDHSIPSI